MRRRPARRPSRAALSRRALRAAFPENDRPSPPSTVPPVPYQRNRAADSQRLAQPDDHSDDGTYSTEYSSEEEEGSSIIDDEEFPYAEAPDHRPRPTENGRVGKRWSFHSPRAFREQLSQALEGPRNRFSTPNVQSSDVTSPSSEASRSGVPGGNILVQVRRWVLEGNGTALRKGGRLSEIRKKGIGYKTVTVEGNPEGLAQTCLYASDQMIHSPLVEPYKATEPITSRSEYVDKESVVYRGLPFEIGVVGMCVSSDAFKDESGDMLMYSMQRDASDTTDESDALPFIHYDPSRDGLGVQPDQFISIPASRSLFLASDGKETGFEPRKSVNCRFKILELEKVDEAVQISMAGIEKLGNHVAQYSRATPLLGLLSPALSLASTVSQRALDSHSKLERVVKIDMNFQLAEQRVDQQNGAGSTHFEHCSGEYLRYGYYFFLDKRVDAKLYASFRTFPNVQLMMKRTDSDRIGANERKYFPLTGVSYVVIRVTPRMTGTMNSRRPIRMSHVQRLEELMKAALNDDGRSGGRIVQSLGDLAQELGISSSEKERYRHKIGQGNGTM